MWKNKEINNKNWIDSHKRPSSRESNRQYLNILVYINFSKSYIYTIVESYLLKPWLSAGMGKVFNWGSKIIVDIIR